MENQEFPQHEALDRLYVLPYKKTDIYTIASWLSIRGINEDLCNSVPKRGVVAYYNHRPVCAAFLRVCEGKIGVLEGLVTNRDEAPIIRDVCIDHAVSDIIKRAKKIGIKSMMAWSVDAHTLLRSEKHGFSKTGNVLIVKNLA